MKLMKIGTALVLALLPTNSNAINDHEIDDAASSHSAQRRVGNEATTYPQDMTSSAPKWLTLYDFSTILTTAAIDVFGAVPLSDSSRASPLVSAANIGLESQGADVWQMSMDEAWQSARQREGQHDELNLLADIPCPACSPFVVCDASFGTPGIDRRDTIESILASTLLPLYNKLDMTCFLVQVTPTALSRALASSSNLAVAPMTPEMKLQAQLSQAFDALCVPQMKSARIEASFCPGVTQSDSHASGWALRIWDAFKRKAGYQRSLLRTGSNTTALGVCPLSILEATSIDASTNMLLITVPGTTLNGTSSITSEECTKCFEEALLYIAQQPEICFTSVAPLFEVQNIVSTGVIQSGSSSSKPFYSVGLDGRNQVIAQSDTGLDTNNCYFWDKDNNVVKDKSGSVNKNARKVVQYYAYVDAQESVKGHGTHVAGSLVGRRATDGNQESDGDGDGVARGAKLAFFDAASGDQQLHLPSASNLFNPGYSAGARVHSASWGTPEQNTYGNYDAAVDQYMFDNPDFLFVVAAGNAGQGNNLHSIGSPALAKNCIAVGATQNDAPHISSGQKGPDYLAYFSGRGPTADGRIKPDVVAPGYSVLSARADPSTVGECDNTNSPGLLYKKGTSMATPMVSGSAAIVRQYFLEGWHVAGRAQSGTGFNPSASLVKAVLLNGAVPLTAIQNKDGSITPSKPYDESQGFGRINLLKSLPLAGKNSLAGSFLNEKVIRSGTQTYQVTIASNCKEPLSVTLVWTDPAGSPNCNQGCLLNDLDLYVQQGKAYFYPNGRSKADKINNAERVRIESPSIGATYQITVKAANLIQDQKYSLAITGCINGVSNVASVSATASARVGVYTASDNSNNSTGSGYSDCKDGSDNFKINATTAQNCDWLANNYDSHSFLCEFLDVALECQALCRTCDMLALASVGKGSEKVANTAANGDVRWDGHMFELSAKKELTVQSLNLHLSTSASYQVQVLVRPGSLYSGSNDWTMLFNSTVTGKGYGALTALPQNYFSQYHMTPNSVSTIYATIVGVDELVMQTTNSTTGAIFENTDLSISSGLAVTYPLGKTYQGYSLNGGIVYALVECSDSLETVLIDDTVGNRSCSWLAENMDRYGFACAFAEPSIHCPVACGDCGDISA